MTKSPYIDIDKAFDPMFMECADFTTEQGGLRGTVPCCLFPVESIDPFVETDIDTKVKRANVLVRKRDWLDLEDKPQIGDHVRWVDGSEWLVESCDIEQDWYRMEVRGV